MFQLRSVLAVRNVGCDNWEECGYAGPVELHIDAYSMTGECPRCQSEIFIQD